MFQFPSTKDEEKEEEEEEKEEDEVKKKREKKFGWENRDLNPFFIRIDTYIKGWRGEKAGARAHEARNPILPAD